MLALFVTYALLSVMDARQRERNAEIAWEVQGGDLPLYRAYLHARGERIEAERRFRLLLSILHP